MSHLMTRAQRILSQSKHNPDYIIKAMFTARTAFDLAPYIIAYQHVTGVVPHNPAPLWQDALGVAAEALQAPIPTQMGDPDKTENGLVTKYHEFIPMSDQARSEMAQARRDQGLEYRGPRMLRPRKNYGNFLPEHQLLLQIL